MRKLFIKQCACSYLGVTYSFLTNRIYNIYHEGHIGRFFSLDKRINGKTITVPHGCCILLDDEQYKKLKEAGIREDE
jgi:hypothetical protein